MTYIVLGLVASIAILLFMLILAMRDAIDMAQQAREAHVNAARVLAMFHAATSTNVKRK